MPMPVSTMRCRPSRCISLGMKPETSSSPTQGRPEITPTQASLTPSARSETESSGRNIQNDPAEKNDEVVASRSR